MICENCKCTLSKPSKTSLQTGVCNQCRVQLKTENEDSEIVKEEQFCESCRQDDSRIKDATRKLFGRLSQREREAAQTWLSFYYHLVGEEENDC
ncbi:hypothetical protein A7X95_04630 [Candidatus Nitrosopelagicus brevis]|uniref:Uncharacterized protein n=1 Tax=Candidatus Nitrosopelagicus brevis TaxID=1410606 RepID=A0A0A7V0I7_9ARCH|nr:hypothetical protein [Candidatus Nitrosopelagicus brevis]AJA92542.1 hypothetical protein T478_1401 [Candidatus Nitrosopelagicus brevis]PTL87204.1 hypothetical protein A7X95_04630 [Candidatus Nitrosopelagicus brevis]